MKLAERVVLFAKTGRHKLCKETTDSSILVPMSQVLFLILVYLSLFLLEIASVLQRQNLRSWCENQTKHQAIIQLTPDKPKVLEEFFSLAHLHNFCCLPIIIGFWYSISWAHCSLCLVYTAYPGSLHASVFQLKAMCYMYLQKHWLQTLTNQIYHINITDLPQ